MQAPCPSVPWQVVILQPLGYIEVVGDGDCLFHALGCHDEEDGAALRIDIANYMQEHAAEQQGFEEDWREEVNKLRAYKWGGATVMAAYSLMKNTRVMMHTFCGEGARTIVHEMSHGTLYGKGGLRVVHVLYNGKDHYDCLLELRDYKHLEPAWLQPPPPMYFSMQPRNQKVSEFPALPTEPQKLGDGAPANKNGLAAPRPPKKGQAKGKAKGKAKAKAKVQPAPKPESEEGVTAKVASEEVAAEEDISKPGLMEELLGIPVAETSQHPHRRVEDLIKDQGFQSNCRW